MDPVTRIVILDEVVGGPEPQTQALTQQQEKESSEAAGAFAGAILICIALYAVWYGGLQLIKMIKHWWMAT